MNKFSVAWLEHPNYQIEVVPVGKRIVVEIDKTIIVDSCQALMLNEQGHESVYYFPPSEVQIVNLEKIDKETFCPFKGTAEHWALIVKNKKISIAAWCYEQPFEHVEEIKNHIAFYPEVMEYAIFY